MLKNKIAAITICLFFILSMTASMTLIPNANAHSPPWTIPTYAYINVSPNPCGIGQTVTVGFWLQIPPPTAAGAFGDRWHNLKVTVTKPDGTTQTLGPFTTDDTGGTYTLYTPTTLGNYTFVLNFQGDILAGANHSAPNDYINDTFAPSTSSPATLTVQQEPVPSLPQTPLPTNYWTRPVQSVNGLWSTITGNWLGLSAYAFATTGVYNITGNYNPYTIAPKTAHIIWTRPVAFGGLVGGEFGGSETSNYYSSSQYEPKWATVIMNGIMYYEEFPTSIGTPAGTIAIDLRTGSKIWEDTYSTVQPSTGYSTANATLLTATGGILSLRCGQILDYVSPNQFGSIAYLWFTGTPAFITGQSVASNVAGFHLAPGSTTYDMIDAMTGQYVCSIINGTGMTLTESQGGDLIGYYINSTAGTQTIIGTQVTNTGPSLNLWNSTQCILYPSGYIPGTTANSWSWRPTLYRLYDFANGIMWRTPVATAINTAPITGSLSITTVDSGEVLMTDRPTTALSFNVGWEVEAGYSSTNGAQLWVTNRTLSPYTRVDTRVGGWGVLVEENNGFGTLYGYSMKTGAQLWGPLQLTGTNGGIPVPNPYSAIGGYQSVLGDNGTLYLMGFGGDMWAINILTGTVLWYTNTNTASGNAGSDTPYGVWPLWVFSGGSVADGVWFLNEGHEYSPPLFRGASELAINTTTGKLIWSIMGFYVTGPAPIVDGIMTAENAYDNQVYAYSKGPSATTVEVTGVGITTATPVTITGAVIDTSAGTHQLEQAANFPHGVPCVSDASMTPWMEYVYMQQPMPSNVTGVKVDLFVLDSNNNYRQIGTTTSDASGSFGFTWKPDIAGQYTVFASFAGTQSYYPSTAETYFYASNAAATPAPTSTPLTGLATQTTVMYIGIAIIIVIIVGIAALAMITLRKRP
ncbi:MAG: PQQ-binding-like beta-propeller repeat protein [Candidatus Bathyarchaeia archaeon]